MSVKTAVVTGCSKGIGAAIAKYLSKNGYNVIALSRNIDAMEHEFSEYNNVELYQIDLFNFSEITKFANAYKDLKIDVLVHNAGGGVGNGMIRDDDPSNWVNSYTINVASPMFLTQSLLSNMNIGSNIFVVTSVAGYNTYSGAAAYCAAKRAETSLCESMRKELSDSGIKVTEIIPGSVDSYYDNKPNSISTEDIASAVFWVSSLPKTTNIDSMVLTHINNIR
jgi:NADP-dependent 3-hydroxy acid dehydrogenase YdfG